MTGVPEEEMLCGKSNCSSAKRDRKSVRAYTVFAERYNVSSLKSNIVSGSESVVRNDLGRYLVAMAWDRLQTENKADG